ncbi:MAG: heme exporter protein CcmD [Marinicella sp.]
MMELFDMGKYDFYVWTSIGIFVVALVADFISLKSKSKQIKRQIHSKHLKTQATQRHSGEN